MSRSVDLISFFLACYIFGKIKVETMRGKDGNQMAVYVAKDLRMGALIV